MIRKAEILAPAGSMDSLMAAVSAGADAVYMGGSRFGARAFAENADEDQMIRAIRYVHLHGRKLYMTVNTLVKEREMEDLIAFLRPYYEAGLDAVLVQDMGVLRAIREHFPELPIHTSTQMSVTGAESALELKKLGVTRIVPAREISLPEIRDLHEKTGLEIECFVHGALCFCYSGQCLFSSMIGGRSGNRGRCAQTCRLPFEVLEGKRNLTGKDEHYPLSMKDLCALDVLPELLEGGAFSLKIEGRMKSPRYTAGVVSIYRKYVDYWLEHGREGYRVDPEDRRKLLELFDRGGLTDGYYRRHNGPEMVVFHEKPQFREEDRAYTKELEERYLRVPVKETADAVFTAKVGEPLSLMVTLRETDGAGRELPPAVGYAEGPVCESALKTPTATADLEKQIRKTGNTPFVIGNAEIVTEGNVFVPVKQLNELRREALAVLEENLHSFFARNAGGTENHDSLDVSERLSETGETMICAAECENVNPKNAESRPAGGKNSHNPFKLTAAIESPLLADAVIMSEDISFVYLDSTGFGAQSWKKYVDACHAANKECALILPHMWRTEARRYFEKYRAELANAGFDALMIKNLEELAYVRIHFPDMPVVADANVYTMNHLSEMQLRDFARDSGKGAGSADAAERKGKAAVGTGTDKADDRTPSLRFTLPLELNFHELSERGAKNAELFAYGRVPMMVTAQCFRKNTGKCTKEPCVLEIRDRKKALFPVKNHCRFCYNTIYNAAPVTILGDRAAVEKLGCRWLRLTFTTETPEEAEKVLRAYGDVFLRGRERTADWDYTKGHFRRGVE
ncbi:putative protease [[Clostridium] aminophilum]|uniref:Putative protease n=1 Tax=[Clostridium] aminophilum TaxID=1526 RepID=A0A1I0AIR5_9FIRM|nr:U32 family peptidase [[Clostridium] aminophilum]SES94222.1 putative protease [[Clostridium] aminophilum]